MKNNFLLRLLAFGSIVSTSVGGPVSSPELRAKRVDEHINFNAKASYYTPLRSVQETNAGRLRGRHVRRANAAADQTTLWASADLRNVDDIYYIADLKIGNQTIAVSVDTGSSDTWFIQEPLSCIPFNPDVSFKRRSAAMVLLCIPGRV